MGAVYLDNLEFSPTSGTLQGVPLTCLNHPSPTSQGKEVSVSPRGACLCSPPPIPRLPCPRHIGAALGPLGPAGVSFRSSKRG